MVDLSLDKVKYGGEFHYYFWDKSFNPVATVSDCLPDCTTFVIGDCGVTGTPRPVSKVVGAGNWHQYLANGWTYIPFDKTKIQVGDILQWINNPHVCRVFKIEGNAVYVRGSFYTGEHGYSSKDGVFDTRSSFATTEEVSKFMEKNYPNRFYHENTLEEEAKMCKGMPDYILVMPRTISTVERDESIDQIRTTDVALRIRTGPSLDSAIVGHVSIGFYNVLNIEKATTSDIKEYKERKGDELKCWYEIAKDRWCGDISTEFLAKKTETDVSKALETIVETINHLVDENNTYKEGIKQIAEIANKLI